MDIDSQTTFITNVSDYLKYLVEGAEPTVYFWFFVWTWFFSLSAELFLRSRIGEKFEFLRSVQWLFLVVKWGAVVGFVWGSIPEAFIVAVPVAVWVQEVEHIRWVNEQIWKRKHNQNLGAPVRPLYPDGNV